MLGLSLGLTIGAGGGATAWTPDALYSGVDGARYVPTDYATAFQDIAGATAVTGVGQTLGKLNSKIAGRTALVAIADGSRPVITASGFNTASSKYLTADTLSGLFTAANATWAITLALKSAGALSQVLVSAGASSAGAPYVYLQVSNTAAGGRSQLLSFSTSPNVARTANCAVLASNIPIILTINCKGTTVDTWVNGIKQSVDGQFASNAKALINQVTVGAFRANAVGNYFPGEYRDIEFIGRSLLDTEIVKLHEYLATNTNTVLAPSATCDVFLSCGQSNGAGRGTGGPAVTSGAAWEMYGGGVRALADPLTGTTGGSCWPAFANKWHALTGRRAVIVQCAIGGTFLIPGAAANTWSDAYRNIAVETATDTIRALTAYSKIGRKYVIWCQGEAEGEAYNGTTITDTAYATALTALITYLQTNLSIDGFLVSELGVRSDGANAANWALIRAAQAAAISASTGAYMAFDRAKHFADEGKMSGDGTFVHYSQAGYNEMGEALATYAASLLP